MGGKKTANLEPSRGHCRSKRGRGGHGYPQQPKQDDGLTREFSLFSFDIFNSHLEKPTSSATNALESIPTIASFNDSVRLINERLDQLFISMARLEAKVQNAKADDCGSQTSESINTSSTIDLLKLTERLKTLEGRQSAVQSKLSHFDMAFSGTSSVAWALGSKKLQSLLSDSHDGVTTDVEKQSNDSGSIADVAPVQQSKIKRHVKKQKSALLQKNVSPVIMSSETVGSKTFKLEDDLVNKSSCAEVAAYDSSNLLKHDHAKDGEVLSLLISASGSDVQAQTHISLRDALYGYACSDNLGIHYGYSEYGRRYEQNNYNEGCAFDTSAGEQSKQPDEGQKDMDHYHYDHQYDCDQEYHRLLDCQNNGFTYIGNYGNPMTPYISYVYEITRSPQSRTASPALLAMSSQSPNFK